MGKAETITTKGRKDEGEVIDLTKKQTVVMTAKAPHHESGTVNKVHPKIAEQFIKRGYAVAEDDNRADKLKNAKEAKTEGEKGESVK